MQTRPDDFYARPIVALLLSLIVGIVLGCHFPGYVHGAWPIAFFAAACIGALIIRNKPTGLIPILFFTILGYASLQPWVAPHFGGEHIQNVSDETRWQVSGVVDARPVEFKYLKKFVLRTDTLTYKKASYRVSGKIRVTVRGPSPAVARGDRVVFRSRLRQIRNFNNPGGFNYQRYMAFKGIWRTAYTRGDRLQVVQQKSSLNLAQQLDDSRLAMSALIESAGKGPSRAVLKALVIGDRAAISSGLRDTFNRAGVGHILAISGLHIGIVATVAFLLFQKLLCYVKPLLWRGWTRKGAAIFALFPVFLYGLISGMSPSTQRAVIMVSAFLMTFLVARENDAINTLALAAFIILIVYPPSLFSISFQLSFLAVLSIIYGLSRTQTVWRINTENVRTGFRFWLSRKILAFFLVSFFAICGTLPLVMFYFNQISVIGLLANFVVVPLAGFVVIPCGLLALFCYPISSQIAYGLLKICVFVLDYLLDVIIFLADLPFASFKTFTPSIFEIFFYYILGWFLINLLQSKLNPAGEYDVAKSPPDPALQSTQRQVASKSRHLFQFLETAGISIQDIIAWLRVNRGAIVGILLILALAGDAAYWLYQRFWQPDLQVTYMDVGQGNAALLELPGGHTALIDGGGFSDNNVFDMGARVIAPFLWRKKIHTIDALILTHPNSDHLNGLLYIAQHFNVKTVWTNGESRTTQGYRRFKKIVSQKQLNLPDFKNMPRKQRINGVEFSFMYPPPDFLDKMAVQKWRNTNNNSLVLKVSFGDISFLFPGDIMAEAEKELVSLSGADLACTVLLAPHHGSRSSSSRLFLSHAQPDVAVISAGWKNRFKFPHSTVLEAYEKSGCRIMRTDQNGAITFITDGKRLHIRSFLSEADLNGNH